jgi:hypothetical protein
MAQKIYLGTKQFGLFQVEIELCCTKSKENFPATAPVFLQGVGPHNNVVKVDVTDFTDEVA